MPREDEACSTPVDPQIITRWRRARELFEAVADLPASERAARLDTLCPDDAEMRDEVRRLLSHDRAASDTIGRVVADAALEAVEWSLGPQAAIPETIGRYRIIEKIGEGGMGEVFLAEDASLGRRVALKLPAAPLSGDPRARQRLQQEARAAATLNHPHVCIIHEVGEGPDGRPFIAMEYVEGETLAARIQRGPLPARELHALARQAAGALQAAHAVGIVHRDLKSSNIMLTAHGIKLLDFGLASAARDATAMDEEVPAAGFMGTVPYMSPEQVRGESVDHRTDLFSFGVVLYEASTGRLPFEGSTRRDTSEAILGREPVPPAQLVPDLPAVLNRVIMRALSKAREARHQTAAALSQDLIIGARASDISPPRASSSSRLRTRVRWIAAALLALVVAAAIAYRLGRTVPATVAPPADVAILLADFTNATGDAAFDGTLRQALVVQLQQTPFLRLFPEAGVQETLRQMTRPADTRLSDAVAEEIARRRGIQAWVSGSIVRAGAGFAISLTATRGGDAGEVIARERVEAARRDDVLPALGAAATRLRERLGESLQSIGQFNAPIQQATTASLDALKAYTLATQQSARGDYATSVALFERAVQIDPEFAMAYQALAREQTNGTYAREAIVANATRAFELRDRATEQERFAIEKQFHASVARALERAVATSEEWRDTYPRDWRPYHALADLHFSLGQYAEAVEAGRRAVLLNPDVAAVYSNLAGALFALGRFAEAKEVYRTAMARGLDAPEYHAFLWRIAYYLDDAEGMRRQNDWAVASSTWGFNMPALAAGLQGRWQAARRSSDEATAFFERRNMPGLVAMAARYEALTGALVGDCASAKRSASRIVQADQWTQEQARGVLAQVLCGDTRHASALVHQLRRAYPEDTMLNAVWLPLVDAAATLRQGRPAEAVAMLRITQPYEGSQESWPIYVRGLALLESGAPAAAEVEFQKIIDHPGRTFWFPLAPLARLGLARAKVRDGDEAGARAAYETLFESWKDADPDLPVLVDARKEYARLR